MMQQTGRDRWYVVETHDLPQSDCWLWQWPMKRGSAGLMRALSTAKQSIASTPCDCKSARAPVLQVTHAQLQ